MKSKEEIIREELRSLRDVLFKLIQWGVSVLVGAQTALFFVRREVVKGLIERDLGRDQTVKDAVKSLVESGKLAQGGLLPWHRYLMGTVFLLAVSCIFSGVTIYGSSQYRHYRDELTKLVSKNSGVSLPTPSKTPRRLIIAMYMFFPLFDIVVRVFLPHA